MANTTPVYGIPYLELADPPNLATGTQNLATEVETELIRIDALVAGLTRLQYAFTTSTINTPVSAAFGNITGFSFAAVAGKTYAIDCVMYIDNPNSSTPDWRSGWSWTGTGAMTSGQSGVDTSVTAPAYNGSNTAHAVINAGSSPSDEGTGLGTPAAIPVIARISATYVCATSGTVQMRHAQMTSDATFVSRVLHGSRMRVERLN